MPTISKKRIKIYKDSDFFEELLPEEEAAIEEGRKAYARGEWIELNKIKNGVADPRHKTGAKKS